MADFSFSALPSNGGTNNASDVNTPLNELKAYVNSADWVDSSRLADSSVATANIQTSAVTTAKVGTRPYCMLRNASALSSTSGSALSLTFDTEDADTDTMHSTSSNTNRLVFTTAGIYQVSLSVLWDTNGTGIRYVTALLTGSGTQGFTGGVAASTPAVTGFQTVLNASALVKAAANDYIVFTAYQNSGGALNVTPLLQAAWLGPTS